MRKLILVILLLLPVDAYAIRQEQFVSPDGAIAAVVVTDSFESRIEFRSVKTGKILRTKDYSSKDREHGAYVLHTSWTPDSAFFVYSLASSGGHQPWNSPVDFYSRKENKVRRLDDYVGAVAEPDFKIKPPDLVEIYITPTGKNFGKFEQKKVHLHSLVNAK